MRTEQFGKTWGKGKLPPGTFEQAEKNIAEMSKAIDEAIVSIRQHTELSVIAFNDFSTNTGGNHVS